MRKGQDILEYINLLRKIAWSFHRSTGIDFDDLFQEAFLAYDYAIKHHDPKRSKVSTYIWLVVASALKRYVRKEFESWGFISSLDDESDSDYIPDSQEPVSEFLDQLNEQARQLAATILSAPKIFLEIPADKAKKRLAHTMIKKGWRWRDVWIGMKDLDRVCSK
jgi:RNA polymerase sigma factor (sigma-70 family)